MCSLSLRYIKWAMCCRLILTLKLWTNEVLMLLVFLMTSVRMIKRLRLFLRWIQILCLVLLTHRNLNISRWLNGRYWHLMYIIMTLILWVSLQVLLWNRILNLRLILVRLDGEREVGPTGALHRVSVPGIVLLL